MAVYTGKITDLPEAPGNFMANTSKKVIYGPDSFWSDYVMRCFRLAPGAGTTQPHEHPWPHWLVVFEGEGVWCVDGVEYPLERGDYMFVPGGVPHYNYNRSNEKDFCFFCIVPPEGDVPPTKKD